MKKYKTIKNYKTTTKTAHGVINAILEKRAKDAPESNKSRELYIKLDGGRRIPLRWAFFELFKMKQDVPELSVHSYGAKKFFETMEFKVWRRG